MTSGRLTPASAIYQPHRAPVMAVAFRKLKSRQKPALLMPRRRLHLDSAATCF
jgi:hypothetical protein